MDLTQLTEVFREHIREGESKKCQSYTDALKANH